MTTPVTGRQLYPSELFERKARLVLDLLTEKERWSVPMKMWIVLSYLIAASKISTLNPVVPGAEALLVDKYIECQHPRSWLSGAWRDFALPKMNRGFMSWARDGWTLYLSSTLRCFWVDISVYCKHNDFKTGDQVSTDSQKSTANKESLGVKHVLSKYNLGLERIKSIVFREKESCGLIFGPTFVRTSALDPRLT